MNSMQRPQNDISFHAPQMALEENSILYRIVLHSGSWKLLLLLLLFLLLLLLLVVVVVVVVGWILCQVAKHFMAGSLGSRVKETITV